jgi:mannose-6-phosphate isomerase-like protein (cupin superfamily)
VVAAGHLDQELPRPLWDVGVGGVLDDRGERAVDVEQHCTVLWIFLQRGDRIGQGRGRHVTSMAGMSESKQGDGYAVSSLDAMGDGYGFRKIRQELSVTAFGINALVLPAGYAGGTHYHERQEETYFVHQGEVEFRFGDDSTHRVRPGGVVRVDPRTHRSVRNVGDTDAILVVAGGEDGYVGRDGQAVGGSGGDGPPGAA